MLVGGGIVISLRVLGVASGRAAAEIPRLLSGDVAGRDAGHSFRLLLLVAYPAKALTNPVFPLKLHRASLPRHCWCAGWRAMHSPRRHAMKRCHARSRATAAVALVLWLAVVATGKLLLYTYSVLQVS